MLKIFVNRASNFVLLHKVNVIVHVAHSLLYYKNIFCAANVGENTVRLLKKFLGR